MLGNSTLLAHPDSHSRFMLRIPRNRHGPRSGALTAMTEISDKFVISFTEALLLRQSLNAHRLDWQDARHRAVAAGKGLIDFANSFARR